MKIKEREESRRRRLEKKNRLQRYDNKKGKKERKKIGERGTTNTRSGALYQRSMWSLELKHYLFLERVHLPTRTRKCEES